MKSIIKVYQINKQNDVNEIQRAMSKIEGIIAYEISFEKREIHIIYNENFVDIDKIVEIIENLGYMVI